MDITIKIDDSKIAGLICTGFEGGMTRHWCRIMKTRKPRTVKPVLDQGQDSPQAWPYYDYPLLGGATVCRLDDGESDDTDRKYKPLVLDRAAIDRGLRLMAEKYPGHFGNFLAENDDAITGDVFLQLCMLGDVVYG